MRAVPVMRIKRKNPSVLPVVCVVVLSEYRPIMQRRIEYAVSAYVGRNVLRIIRYYVLVLRHALSIQAVLKINIIMIKQLCKEIPGQHIGNYLDS